MTTKTKETPTRDTAIWAIAKRMEIEQGGQRKALNDEWEKANATIKAYLEQEEELIDEEFGVRAFLSTVAGDRQIDFAYASDDEIVLLARAGLLRPVNETASKALLSTNFRAAELWNKYTYEGAPTPRLKVMPL